MLYYDKDDLAIGAQIDDFIEHKAYGKLYDLLLSLDEHKRTQLLITLVQIHGIYIDGVPVFDLSMIPENNPSSDRRFNVVNVLINDRNFNLVLRPEEETFIEIIGEYFYIDKKKIPIRVFENSEPGTNDRGLGFYFPKYNENRSVLRINPKNTGYCPGKCLFCQRMYFLPNGFEISNRRFWKPGELIAQIKKTYPENIFSTLERIVIITELFGSFEKYYDFCMEFKTLVKSYGFKGQFDATAQDIQSMDDILKFKELVDAKDFCFSLECFENREKYMSRYKAIAMEKIYNILKSAKKAGFNRIAINYVAGLDTFADFENNMEMLLENSYVDEIGLNIFAAYSINQSRLGAKERKTISYYMKIINVLRKHKIRLYRPEWYGRCPAIAHI